MPETLTALIAGFRAGIADFEKNAPLLDGDRDIAYVDDTFGPYLVKIREFDGAATSHAEALLALEMAVNQLKNGETETPEVLIRAAALFLREVCVG